MLLDSLIHFLPKAIDSSDWAFFLFSLLDALDAALFAAVVGAPVAFGCLRLWDWPDTKSGFAIRLLRVSLSSIERSLNKPWIVVSRFLVFTIELDESCARGSNAVREDVNLDSFVSVGLMLTSCCGMIYGSCGMASAVGSNNQKGSITWDKKESSRKRHVLQQSQCKDA